MKTLYLHVGPHKTGSTYLQKLWIANRHLLKDNGLVYPEVFTKYYGHHKLAEHLIDSNYNASYKAGIEQLKKIPEDIILSSEDFILVNKEGFQKLKEDLNGIDIKVVFYFRSPTVRFLSEWQEMIKHGYSIDFFEHYFKRTMKIFQSSELNYSLWFDMFIDLFGMDNVKIIDYENAFKSSQMMANFEKILDKNIIADENILVNTMLDLSTVEIIRILNYKASKDGLLSGLNVREKFVKLLDNKEINIEKLSELIKQHNSVVMLGQGMIDKHMYNQINTVYGECLVNELAELKEIQYELPSTLWLEDKNVQSEITQLYKQIKDAL
ncbi:MAG: hypothetical protein IE909_16910 [Campylobacterales bacterium]|nr:hypothetical protein [Campylobacterales bacterium]